MDPTAMDNTALEAALNEAVEADVNTTDPQPEADAPKADEAATSETPDEAATDPEKAELQKKLEVMEKRLRDKDSHIGKLKHESDQVKAKLEQLTVPDRPTNDDFAVDPAEANERLLEHKQALKQKEELEQQQKLLEQMELNRSVVSQTVEDFEALIPEIGKVLVEDDGLDSKLVEQFLSNPFYADPVGLIQMAKRAKSRNETVQLREENEKLKAEIDSLRKKPANVLDQVDRATRNGPSVSAKTGRSAPKTGEGAPVNQAQLAALSYDQLTAALKEANEG